MFAVVDLETTGGIPDNDHIIEVAVYLHDGQQITGSFSSLVNPGKEIPPFISRLTGITDEMVQRAPSFSDVAGQIAEMLADKVFVAHNVMFDYTFLSHHLGKEGYEMTHKLFCTCHSGRKLLPGHPSYSLGKLCRSLGINLRGAHRAEADARATVALLEMMLDKTNGNLEDFLQDKHKRRNVSSIPEDQLNKLPNRPGVLYFRDEKNQVIFVTGTKNLRKKAWAIVSKFKNNRYAALAGASHSVDFVVTGGHIMAAIIESREILELKPRLNRKSRFIEKRFAVYCGLNDSGYLTLYTALYDLTKKPVATFHSAAEARKELKKVLLDSGVDLTADDSRQLLFRDDVNTHNSKVEAVIEQLRQRRRNFIITEKGPAEGEITAILIRDAAYQGYARLSPDETPQSPEFISDRLKYEDDSPAVMNSIIRLVSKGEYQKIINFI